MAKLLPGLLLKKDVATYVRYSKNKENATISIIAETGVTYDKMHIIMKIASGLKLRAIWQLNHIVKDVHSKTKAKSRI